MEPHNNCFSAPPGYFRYPHPSLLFSPGSVHSDLTESDTAMIRDNIPTFPVSTVPSATCSSATETTLERSVHLISNRVHSSTSAFIGDRSYSPPPAHAMLGNSSLPSSPGSPFRAPVNLGGNLRTLWPPQTAHHSPEGFPRSYGSNNNMYSLYPGSLPGDCSSMNSATTTALPMFSSPAAATVPSYHPIFSQQNDSFYPRACRSGSPLHLSCFSPISPIESPTMKSSGTNPNFLSRTCNIEVLTSEQKAVNQVTDDSKSEAIERTIDIEERIVECCEQDDSPNTPSREPASNSNMSRSSSACGSTDKTSQKSAKGVEGDEVEEPAGGCSRTTPLVSAYQKRRDSETVLNKVIIAEEYTLPQRNEVVRVASSFVEPPCSSNGMTTVNNSPLISPILALSQMPILNNVNSAIEGTASSQRVLSRCESKSAITVKPKRSSTAPLRKRKIRHRSNMQCELLDEYKSTIPVGIAVARQRHEQSTKEEQPPTANHLPINKEVKPIFLNNTNSSSNTADLSIVIPTPSGNKPFMTNTIGDTSFNPTQWEDSSCKATNGIPTPWAVSAVATAQTLSQPTLWLGQSQYSSPLPLHVSSLDATHVPLPPVGFQLVRDPISGHILLLPAADHIQHRMIWSSYQPPPISQPLPISQPVQPFVLPPPPHPTTHTQSLQLLPQDITDQSYRIIFPPTSSVTIPSISSTSTQSQHSIVTTREVTVTTKQETTTEQSASRVEPDGEDWKVNCNATDTAPSPLPFTFQQDQIPFFYQSPAIVHLAQASQPDASVQTDSERRSQGTSPVNPCDSCLTPPPEAVTSEEEESGEVQVQDASNQTETPPISEDETSNTQVKVEVKEEKCEEDESIEIGGENDEFCSAIVEVPQTLMDCSGLELLCASIEVREKDEVIELNHKTEICVPVPQCSTTEGRLHGDSNLQCTTTDNSSFATDSLTGLKILCALAAQRISEDREKRCALSNQQPSTSADRSYRNPRSEREIKAFIANRVQAQYDNEYRLPSGLMSSDCIGSMELEMRLQLAELQRRYRAKQKELARLNPKKDHKKDDSSPTKRGPGRPKKGKLAIGHRSKNRSGDSNSRSSPSSWDKMSEMDKSTETKVTPKVKFCKDILRPSALITNKYQVKKSSHHDGKEMIRTIHVERKEEKVKLVDDKVIEPGVKKRKQDGDNLSVVSTDHSLTPILTHTASKKRKPGSPKRHSPTQEDATETIVAKKPRNISFLLSHPFPPTEETEVYKSKIKPKLKAEAKVKTSTYDDDDEWPQSTFKDLPSFTELSISSRAKSFNSHPVNKVQAAKKVVKDVVVLVTKPLISKPEIVPKKLKKVVVKSKVAIAAHKKIICTNGHIKVPPKVPKKSVKLLKKVNVVREIVSMKSKQKNHAERSEVMEEQKISKKEEDMQVMTQNHKVIISDLPSCIVSEEELKDKLRVLILMDGLFYAGYINAIQAPDVYGVTLDRERGNRAHIYSREEILKDTVLEVKANTFLSLREGTRVCAFWSQQYRCMYPGTISKSPVSDVEAEKNFVNVEFDDGDNGRIHLDDIRLLPQGYPLVEYDPNPLLSLGKRKRQASGASIESQAKDGKILKQSTQESPPQKKNRQETKEEKTGAKKVSKPVKPKAKVVENGKSAKKLLADKINKSKKKDLKKQARLMKKLLEKKRSMVDEKKKKKRLKKLQDGKHKHHHKHHKHSKHDKDKGKEEISTTDESSSDNAVNNAKSNKTNKGDKKSKKVNTDNKKDPTKLKKSAILKKKKEHQQSSESVSKMAAFLPARQLWSWSGKGYKRPGGNKGKGKKEFFKSIQRGEENIRVGDCAVFLSTGRPDRPYIGRIEFMWASWGGNMVVKVKWFYHPEETKGGKCLSALKFPGALFESPHEDENDVQTISHKCQVLAYGEYCKKMNQDPSRYQSTYDNNDSYYLAGHYDPTNGILTMEPSING